VVCYILLSGQFPFQEERLFEDIENATYSLSGREWQDISMEAKHFIRSLMTLRPDQRMSVKDALKHEWIRGAKLPIQLVTLTSGGSVSSVAPKKRSASVRGKKSVMKKHATVCSQSQPSADEETNSMEISNPTSRAASTFQPLTSGPSRVLFWSLRKSVQGVLQIICKFSI